MSSSPPLALDGFCFDCRRHWSRLCANAPELPAFCRSVVREGCPWQAQNRCDRRGWSYKLRLGIDQGTTVTVRFHPEAVILEEPQRHEREEEEEARAAQS